MAALQGIEPSPGGRYGLSDRGIRCRRVLLVRPHDGIVQWAEICFVQLGERTVTLSSNRLAIFTASRWCTDEVKVVSRSLTQATVGIG